MTTQEVSALGRSIQSLLESINNLSESLAIQLTLNDDIQATLDAQGLAIDLVEAMIKTSNTDRRINRSISVKGIVQYDGKVEGHGLTHEEFMVEQAKMDLEIDRLQPQYEEFVEPLLPKPIIVYSDDVERAYIEGK